MYGQNHVKTMTKQPTDNKKHSILFLLKSLNMGGVEIVTATLANKFVNEGHRVCIFSFFEPSASMRERIDERVTIYQLRKFAITAENVQALRAAMIEEGVDIVINQWGLPLVPIKVINQARKGLNIKVISVYHNDPLSNGRIQGVKTQLMHTRNCVKRVVLKLKLWAFRQVTSKAMAYIYHHSDRFMVLSPSFVRNFQQFTGVRDLSHLIVQTNPITIDTSTGKDCLSAKKKEIVFVGRIDMTQKRIDRIIEVWKLIEHKHPDWTLRIVGDGEDRAYLEKLSQDLDLKHVSFEGFQQPRPYYERASILILTSEFEGFPLVLAECMSFGVIPAVYGSYSAVYDIIEDGIDGIITPYNKSGYKPKLMAERLSEIMNDEEKMQNMAKKAIVKSKRYSIEIIYKDWIKVIDRM